MGTWCLNCSKVMKEPELTHCSDECVLEYVKKSESKREDDNYDGKSVEYWKEGSNPWR